MSGGRWDSATNIKFIEAYEQEVCLWDPKNLEYKNRDSRNVAYGNIIEVMEMDLTVKDVISKIRSLRNTYNSEMLKSKKSLTSGIRGYKGKLYISKIPWLDSLDFLKNIDGFSRTNTDNLQEQENQQTPSTSSNSESDNDSNTQSLNYSIRSPKKARTCPLTQAVKSLEKMTSQQLSKDKNDEFNSFGNVVAIQLRTLPLEMALESEEIILAVLRKQRIKALKLRRNKEIDNFISVSTARNSESEEVKYT